MKMQDYVKYAPRQLQKNIQANPVLTEKLDSMYQESNAQYVTFVASGSSYNSAKMVVPIAQKLLNKPVFLQTPEAVLENGIFDQNDNFVIVISQSGSSTNIIQCLKYLQEQKIREVSLTGNVESPMAEYSTEIIDYQTGNEYVDFVTVGVTTLVLFLELFAINSSGLSFQKKQELIQRIGESINSQDEVLRQVDQFIDINRYALSQDLPTFFVGNGVNNGIAKEAALKFQETLKRPAMYYELEEFLHGPDMQLNPNYTVFLLDDFNHLGRFDEVYRTLKIITKNVFLITDNHEYQTDSSVIVVPKINQELSCPFLFLPPIQLIASVMTDELNRWGNHRYFDDFDKKVSIKSADYQEELKQIKHKWEKGDEK